MSSLNEVLVTAGLTGGGLELLGGKGANLARLAEGGFPVPDGFMITTAAYRHHVAALDLDASDAAATRRRITDRAVDTGLAEQIEAAYERLGGGAVAVRSSATAEDLPGAAFAGQQDTYLDITGEGLLDAVVRCWASLWTDRAVSYRNRLGLDPDEVAIAVVVQRMIHPDAAGVMFTADPVTGRRDRIMIDATAGLGEALVSGEVTPDHYLLDQQGVRLEFSPGAIGNKDPLLEESTLSRLAAQGTAVAESFGGPQDIEWAVAGDDLWLLQARPMTALPEPGETTAVQRFAASVASDYLSQRPYPLDVTTWLPHGPAGQMLRIAGHLGLVIDITQALPETDDGVVVRFEPPRPTVKPRILINLPRMIFRTRLDPGRWQSDPRVSEITARLAAQHDDPAELPWPGLVARAEEAFAVADLSGDVRERFMPGMAGALGRLQLTLALVGARPLAGPLAGGAATTTTRANAGLSTIAAHVRSSPEAAELVAATPVPDLLRMLDDTPALAGLASELRDLLAEYGHRETSSPVLVSAPTWADDPAVPLGAIKSLVVSDDAPGPSRSAEAERRLFSRPFVARTPLRRLLRRVITTARAATAFREDSHDLLIRPAPLLRRTLLEMGRRLCAEDVLAEPFDVFHLRWNELTAIDDPAQLSESERERLTGLVRIRMITREQLAAVPMIIQPERETSADESVIIGGTPAGTGRATGPARVILSPSDFGSMQPGEVLVCPYTNPAWTPLFRSAIAVVADTGGVGSHAAIVAREYGLPAVMGTSEGTRRIHTGDMITVDGSRGLVSRATAEA